MTWPLYGQREIVRDVGCICWRTVLDELVIAVVLSWPFFVLFVFSYSAPSSGLYKRFALNKYFIIMIIITAVG